MSPLILLPSLLLTSSFSPSFPLSSFIIQVILMNMLNVAQVTVTKTTSLGAVSWQVTFAEVAQVPLFTVYSSSFFCSGVPYSPIITYTQNFNATSVAMASAAYAWQVVPSLGYQAGGSYVLTNLLPGATYYARVSAVTGLGVGARRLAAPNAFTVPITPPSAPTQREGSWGLPRLFLSSPSSLTVRIGPPTFDGGSLAAQYVVEWDTVSTFNSGSSGQPLGIASVNAYTVACTGCVSAITFAYNAATLPIATIIYTGNSNTVLMLRAGVRVVVVTTDDHLPSTFEVADVQATTTSFTVQSAGLREYVFNALSHGLPFADLYVMGADYEMKGLASGLNYFVRVKAENAAGACASSMQFIDDCGAFIPTSPSAIVPRGAPAAPVSLVASVLDAQTVRVNWTAPASIGAIVSYRIGTGLA